MNINTRSWHYRLLTKVGFEPWDCHNLCAYMRRLSILFILSVEAICILLFTITHIPEIWIAILWFLGHLSIFWYLPIFAIVVVVIEVGIIKLYLRYKKRNIPKPKQSSILLEWIKAKHRKICPLITFVSDDINNLNSECDIVRDDKQCEI